MGWGGGMTADTTLDYWSEEAKDVRRYLTVRGVKRIRRVMRSARLCAGTDVAVAAGIKLRYTSISPLTHSGILWVVTR